MVIIEAIRAVLNPRKSRLLLLAEAALGPSQFRAYRKAFLNELGSSGLEQDLVRVVSEARQGAGGNIHAGKRVPHG